MCVVHNTVSDNLLCIDATPNLRIRNEETLFPIISVNHFIFLVLHHFLQSTERNHKTATIGNILIKRQFSVTLCKRQDIKRIETIQSILRQFLELLCILIAPPFTIIALFVILPSASIKMMSDFVSDNDSYSTVV